jgi:hypothetical protein
MITLKCPYPAVEFVQRLQEQLANRISSVIEGNGNPYASNSDKDFKDYWVLDSNNSWFAKFDLNGNVTITYRYNSLEDNREQALAKWLIAQFGFSKPYEKDSKWYNEWENFIEKTDNIMVLNTYMSHLLNIGTVYKNEWGEDCQNISHLVNHCMNKIFSVADK